MDSSCPSDKRETHQSHTYSTREERIVQHWIPLSCLCFREKSLMCESFLSYFILCLSVTIDILCIYSQCPLYPSESWWWIHIRLFILCDKTTEGWTRYLSSHNSSYMVACEFGGLICDRLNERTISRRPRGKRDEELLCVQITHKIHIAFVNKTADAVVSIDNNRQRT